MSIEDFIITVYCLIDDELKNMPKLRQRGFNPSLSDAEMITMEIVAEFMSIDTDKGAWEYFLNHWRDLFPDIGSRANYAKHEANLWSVKQQLQKQLAISLGGFSDPIHLSDGFPMPVCHFQQLGRKRPRLFPVMDFACAV